MKTTEYSQARQELQRAWENFNNADENFIDSAIFDLKSAEVKFESLMREYKNE